MMNIKEEILKIELKHTIGVLKIMVDVLREENYGTTVQLVEDAIKSAEEVLKA